MTLRSSSRSRYAMLCCGLSALIGAGLGVLLEETLLLAETKDPILYLPGDEPSLAKSDSPSTSESPSETASNALQKSSSLTFTQFDDPSEDPLKVETESSSDLQLALPTIQDGEAAPALTIPAEVPADIPTTTTIPGTPPSVVIPKHPQNFSTEPNRRYTPVSPIPPSSTKNRTGTNTSVSDPPSSVAPEYPATVIESQSPIPNPSAVVTPSALPEESNHNDIASGHVSESSMIITPGWGMLGVVEGESQYDSYNADPWHIAIVPREKSPVECDNCSQHGPQVIEHSPLREGQLLYDPANPVFVPREALKAEYKRIYESIPYSPITHKANPGYRHEATMAILFGKQPPKIIHIHEAPPAPPAPQIVIRPYRDYGPYRINHNLWYWKRSMIPYGYRNFRYSQRYRR